MRIACFSSAISPRRRGAAFAGRFDFLDSIGKLAGQDLSSYRLLAVADSDQALLRDEVIANVTGWLKAQPGCSTFAAHCQFRRRASSDTVGY